MLVNEKEMITHKKYEKLSGYNFRIPLYQRKYAWSEDEVNALLEDLLSNKNSDYYIGNIVVEQREDKRPLMSDLKESGSIEQDADIVMFLYCDDYYKFKSKDRPQLSPTELIISKHRSGGTGTIDLIFERTYTNFKNVIKSEENENE